MLLTLIEYFLSCIQSLALLSISIYCLWLYLRNDKLTAKRRFYKLLSIYILIAITLLLLADKSTTAGIWSLPIEMILVVITVLLTSICVGLYNCAAKRTVDKVPIILVFLILIASFFLPLTISMPFISYLVRGGRYSVIFLLPVLVYIAVVCKLKVKALSFLAAAAMIFYLAGSYTAWRYVAKPEQIGLYSHSFKYTKPAGWIAAPASDDSQSSVEFTMSYSGFNDIKQTMSGGIRPSVYIIKPENIQNYLQLKDYFTALVNDFYELDQDAVMIDGLEFTRLYSRSNQSIPGFEIHPSRLKINNFFLYNDEELIVIVYYGLDSNLKDFDRFFKSIQWLDEKDKLEKQGILRRLG